MERILCCCLSLTWSSQRCLMVAPCGSPRIPGKSLSSSSSSRAPPAHALSFLPALACEQTPPCRGPHPQDPMRRTRVGTGRMAGEGGVAKTSGAMGVTLPLPQLLHPPVLPHSEIYWQSLLSCQPANLYHLSRAAGCQEGCPTEEGAADHGHLC